MTNKILADLRGHLFELEDTVDTIDRWFQQSDKEFFLDEIKEVETKMSVISYELDYIKNKVSDKLDELEE